MDYQLAIIGGGPAGYTAAEAAARAGLRVVLFEKDNLGGTCLNEGCIPTKTLLYSAKTADAARHAARYAVRLEGQPAIDLPKAVARKQKVVRKLVLGIKARLTACGVQVVGGEATVADAHHVCCGNETYETSHLMLCTGSETVIPPIQGLDSVPYWTHRQALDCKEQPQSLAIVGGGVIGMEFASFFHSLGTQVTVIEMTGEILGGMDREVAALLRAEYARRGVTFCLDTRVSAVQPATAPDGSPLVQLTCTAADGHTTTLTASQLLLSAGRRPLTHGSGLENLHLDTTEHGHIKVDEHLCTSVPGVYACGDLTGRSMLAHTAVRQAEVAVNHILGRTDAMSYSAIPAVVYTNPEVAGVGQTEEALQQAGTPHRTVKLPMAYSGRFVAENEGVNGLCKLLLADDGTVLGAHLLGNPASEIVTLAAMAIDLGLKAEEWKRIVFPHPTVGEIFREALG